MWLRVVCWDFTDVSEEDIASVRRVSKLSKQAARRVSYFLYHEHGSRKFQRHVGKLLPYYTELCFRRTVRHILLVSATFGKIFRSFDKSLAPWAYLNSLTDESSVGFCICLYDIRVLVIQVHADNDHDIDDIDDDCGYHLLVSPAFFSVYTETSQRHKTKYTYCSVLLCFWTSFIVWYSDKTRRFGNWICFRPHVKGRSVSDCD
jgi:hypothetical protein